MDLIIILQAGVASGTVLLFATLGGIFSERAGIMQLGMEGMMLLGAMTAFSVTIATGSPWLGMLAMVWFTLVIGIFLGWASLRGGSVWPAVIGHAAINGIAGIGALMVQGQPNPLLGPLPTGLVASAAWSALALWLFLSPKALRPEEGASPTPA